MFHRVIDQRQRAIRIEINTFDTIGREHAHPGARERVKAAFDCGVALPRIGGPIEAQPALAETARRVVDGNADEATDLAPRSLGHCLRAC